MPRPFVVLTARHPDANTLIDDLNRVAGVQAHMELLYEDLRRRPPRAGCNDYPRFVEIGSRFGHGRRPGSLFAYFNRFYSRPGALGFKLCYGQLRTWPEIIAYIAVRRLAVIHLQAPFESQARIAARAAMPGEMTRDRILRSSRHEAMIRVLLKILPVPVLNVRMGELERSSVIGGICDFIGVRTQPNALADGLHRPGTHADIPTGTR